MNTIYTYLLDNCLASSVYLRNFEWGLSSKPPGGAGGLLVPAAVPEPDPLDPLGITVVLFNGTPALLAELLACCCDDFNVIGSGMTPSLTKCILDK